MDGTISVLSFDIGTINMAYCLVEIKNKRIRIKEWKLLNIDVGNLERTASLFITLVQNTFNPNINKLQDNHKTWVLVERQVPTNYNCFALSYVVWSYFMSSYKKANVSFVNAIDKPLESVGKKRKRESVTKAIEILNDNEEYQWLKWLNTQNKKDDLCDAYLQIIGNIDKII